MLGAGCARCLDIIVSNTNIAVDKQQISSQHLSAIPCGHFFGTFPPTAIDASGQAADPAKESVDQLVLQKMCRRRMD
ncbi:unnamed protein product [Peronospora belbahrii]|uniref:Uncharacterized protein n=1 Tax=Peronospora belbahrii TaxID=622444 RepID=A0ABN8CP55_9STRA|nr:unnamed protein product [Peronospora belbahrii]